MWVLEYLDDLESDFSAIHGIRDIYTELDGPKFFKFAVRMTAYEGVMAARAAALQDENNPQPQSQSSGYTASQPTTSSGSPRVDNIDAVNMLHGSTLISSSKAPYVPAS